MEETRERQLEKEIGWEAVIEGNRRIGIWLKFPPEIEWEIARRDETGKIVAIIYSPKGVGGYFPSDWQQKQECERWISEHPSQVEESYGPCRRENYPYFHNDWNPLMEAVDRLIAKGHIVHLSTNRNEVWKQVAEKCPAITGNGQ